MAAGDKVHMLRSFDALTAVTRVEIEAATVFTVDPGNINAAGPADFLVNSYGLSVTVFGEDDVELLGLLGAAAADHTIGTKGAAAANETFTVHDLYFDEAPGEVVAPESDAGGKVPEYSVRGSVNWDDGETFADKLAAA